MKFCSRPFLCLLAVSASLASCRSPLPNEADLDHAYKQSQALAQQDLADLDQRRARGEISATQYAEMKQAIMDRITARANELVLTQQSLVQSRRQAVGLPTPEAPQDIAVPQAGTLATGTARRQFNDSGGADGTGAGLGFLPGGTIGMGGQNFGSSGSAGPVTAVAVAPAPVIGGTISSAPTPTGFAPAPGPAAKGH